MSETLPPNPDKDGWHFLLASDGRIFAREWCAAHGAWRAGFSLMVRPAEAYQIGHRYLHPIPRAAQLAAMGEIVALCAAALAEQDTRFPGTTADDGVIWKPYPSITAGMIRRAAGEV